MWPDKAGKCYAMDDNVIYKISTCIPGCMYRLFIPICFFWLICHDKDGAGQVGTMGMRFVPAQHDYAVSCDDTKYLTQALNKTQDSFRFISGPASVSPNQTPRFCSQRAFYQTSSSRMRTSGTNCDGQEGFRCSQTDGVTLPTLLLVR